MLLLVRSQDELAGLARGAMPMACRDQSDRV